jgi:2'-5' RNA ligase
VTSPRPDTARLFVAVEIEPPLAAALAEATARVRGLAPRSRWAAGEASHLTLAFHPAVTRDLVPAVGEAVANTAAGHRPFELVVRGAGVFGSPRRPRVLWAAIDGDIAALAAVQADLAAALQRLGLPAEDRAFHPHLTLARARDPRGDAGLAACAHALADSRLGSQTVSGVTLFESRLGPAGARHLSLIRAPFPA